MSSAEYLTSTPSWRAERPIDASAGRPASSPTPAVKADDPGPLEARQLRWLAVGGSFLLHSTLLLILAAWLLPVRPDLQPNSIDTTMGAEEAPLEPLETTAWETPDVAEQEAISRQLFTAAASAAAQSSPAEKSLAELEASLAADAGKGVAAGKRSVGFFGMEAEGNSFVFVVDYSGSMQGYRFSRARTELMRTLSDLSPDQSFYIIFYNHEERPMALGGTMRQLFPATETNVGRARRWVHKQGPLGGTFPDPALKSALELKPDVIFFLSDGAFPRSARTVANEANTHGTIIHTIAFQFDGGKELLKGIAEDNNGRYRFVE